MSELRLTPGTISAEDLMLSFEQKLLDAEALRKAGRYVAATVYGFYALEILLKAKVCQRLDLATLPPAFQIHNLRTLLTLAGLEQTLGRNGGQVWRNWDEIVTVESRHVNALRYAPNPNYDRAQADRFFGQLLSEPDGVIPWLLSRA